MTKEDYDYQNSKDTNKYYQGNQQDGNYQSSSYGDRYEGTYVVRDEDVRRLDAVQTITARAFVFMFIALIITGVSAYLTLETGLFYDLIISRGYMALLFVELAIVFAAGYTLRRNMVIPSAILFITYSIVNGVTLSLFAFIYEMGSIYYIFILTALIFGCMAIYGLVTKRDLTSLGSLGMMGLIGAIIMSVFNMFFIHSSGMSMIISVVVLAVFIGLTAYDAQKIKKMAAQNTTMSMNAIAMFGALSLYLDFINIFIRLLTLFGRKR